LFVFLQMIVLDNNIKLAYTLFFHIHGSVCIPNILCASNSVIQRYFVTAGYLCEHLWSNILIY